MSMILSTELGHELGILLRLDGSYDQNKGLRSHHPTLDVVSFPTRLHQPAKFPPTTMEGLTRGLLEIPRGSRFSRL